MQTTTPKRRGTESVEKVKPKTKRITTEDIDSFLDEIDEVLEDSPQEFLLHFRQKGGQ